MAPPVPPQAVVPVQRAKSPVQPVLFALKLKE
jgi:hypothetical protein